MKTKLSCAVLVLLLVGLLGCSQESPVAPMNALSTIGVYGVNGIPGEFCTTLYAGQTIDVGTVCVEVVDNGDTEDLLVTYTTANGWELVEAHLWVGISQSDMPQTRKGNPKVGNFPYHSGDIAGLTTFTFSVPLDQFGGEVELCDGTLLAAAHAVVQNDAGGSETAWGDGERMVEKGNWATFFGIGLACDPTTPPTPDESVMAFVHGCDLATSFLELDLDGDDVPDFDNWGWTNYIGAEGEYYFDIYAGAGDGDIASGILVGELVIQYYGGSAMFTVTTCGGYTMTETHLYVGEDPLPMYEGGYTVAPAHYPYGHVGLDDVQADTYGPFAVPAGFYVVGQAVVWGDFTVGDCGERGCMFIPTMPI